MKKKSNLISFKSLLLLIMSISSLVLSQHKFNLDITPKIIKVQNFLDETIDGFNYPENDSFKEDDREVKTEIDNPYISDFELKQNYPNPFNPTTTISFKLKKRAQVLLNVYDINGREIANLINGSLRAGTHNIGFNARGIELESGVYIYRLKVNSTIISKKMMYIK